MIVGITGHTQGLGKYLYDHFLSKGNKCIGFSRSNGHDIEDNFIEILNQVKGFDLFINNACKTDIQSRFVDKLKDHKIDIVSIGATSSLFYEEKKSQYTNWKLEYLEGKKKLLDQHTSACYSSKGSILLINLDTLENHPTKKTEFIKFQTVADTIDFWLNNKQVAIVNYLSQNGE